MMGKSIKILSAKQISVQQPLSEEWMDAPLECRGELVHAVDPDFRQFISAADAAMILSLLIELSDRSFNTRPGNLISRK